VLTNQRYESDAPVEFLGNNTTMPGKNYQFLNFPPSYWSYQSTIFCQLIDEGLGH
jgi:hypothetical protein